MLNPCGQKPEGYVESSAHTPHSVIGKRRSVRPVRAASVLPGQRCKWSLKKKNKPLKNKLVLVFPSKTGIDHDGFLNFQSFVNILRDCYFHEVFPGL